MDSQYIYLLRPREFYRHNEATFKIGKTARNPEARLREYSKGSDLILIMKVDNCDITERKIISLFDKIFVKRLEYGLEYYSGDVDKMRNEICTIVLSEVSQKNAIKQKETINKNIIIDKKSFAENKYKANDLLTDHFTLNDQNAMVNDINDDIIDDIDVTGDNIKIELSYVTEKITTERVTKTIASFCKYIYDTKPPWYMEDELVDFSFIEQAYKSYFNDNNATRATISRQLHGVLFSNGKRFNGVTKKNLFPYSKLATMF